MIRSFQQAPESDQIQAGVRSVVQQYVTARIGERAIIQRADILEQRRRRRRFFRGIVRIPKYREQFERPALLLTLLLLIRIAAGAVAWRRRIEAVAPLEFEFVPTLLVEIVGRLSSAPASQFVDRFSSARGARRRSAQRFAPI
ncbi:hypothetical protein [Burkholderia sp. MSMB175]|uniref:hypothetical protein n=1 Tax=Burkholderia sp. MSMB175 TaxID=1086510 RepID=UPI0011AEF34E|nr:hypothetical protein [Burkholderia sp. MSMB175]